jgi:hypothetical protein
MNCSFLVQCIINTKNVVEEGDVIKSQLLVIIKTNSHWSHVNMLKMNLESMVHKLWFNDDMLFK